MDFSKCSAMGLRERHPYTPKEMARTADYKKMGLRLIGKKAFGM